MEVVFVLLISFIVIYALFLILFCILTGKPMRAIMLNTLSGVGLLVILCIFKKHLHTEIALNIYSLAVSAIWGIPGVIMQLLISLLFF